MVTEVVVRSRPDPDKEPERFAASLRGHIVNAHFSPEVLASMGVARYDIELARDRHIPLDWVVKKAYERLEEDEDIVGRRLGIFPTGDGTVFRRLGLWWDPASYRSMLVRNLIYIDQLGLATVDWERVTRSVPDARDIVLDIERDSWDFDSKEALKENSYLILNYTKPTFINYFEEIKMNLFNKEKIFSDHITNKY